MLLSIHQPEHLVWLGFISKVLKSDALVILDTVNFRKNYYQNRNKIKTAKGWSWLTVSVEKHNHKPINQVKIIGEDWKPKYLNLLRENYKKAPYFNVYFPKISEIINTNYTFLSDLNLKLILFILKEFDIEVHITYASNLNLSSLKSSELLLEICQKMKADKYLLGVGEDFLDKELFRKNNISPVPHHFFHPIYNQQYGEFILGMSSIDLLFNYGSKARDIMKAKGKEPLRFILEKYDYESMRILEMFGGVGEGHLTVYGGKAKRLEIWQIDLLDCIKLRRKYPYANVVQTDSLQEMKQSKEKFDIIILDPPHHILANELIPNITRLFDKKGILIFRAIKKKQYPNHNIKVDENLEHWDKVLGKDFVIKNRYEQIREYYYLEDWLYNFVYELERK